MGSRKNGCDGGEAKGSRKKGCDGDTGREDVMKIWQGICCVEENMEGTMR